MTTIIDYVVLNATFSSTTINLVNLDSSVFFVAWCCPDVQPQNRVRSWHRYSTGSADMIPWKTSNLTLKNTEGCSYTSFPKHDPSFE
jgi:hypothetical protein